MISLSTPSSDHLPKHSNHTKIPIISPLQSAKVILKAKQSYKSSRKDELSFSSGEQFYLVKPSQNPDLVLVENASKVQGLVPVKFFEMLIHKDQTGSGIASPLSTPTSADTPLNVAARVKYDIYQMSEKDLPAKAGDMILLLSDHGDHYMAKLINKLGNPGRVLKSMVEIIDSASASAKGFPIPLTKQKSSSYIESTNDVNQRSNYKKYHSEADITKPRSRHSPSTASNSSISTTSTVSSASSASSTATLVAGTESNLQIQSIKPSKAIPHRNQYYLVEYKVYLNDSTKKIIYRKLNQIMDIHKELESMLNIDLPSLPFDVSNYHPVNGPFLSDSDLKAIYQYFKQIAALLPNSGVFTLPPILEFVKLTDSSVKQINIEHPTPSVVSQKSSSQQLPITTASNDDDDELIIPPPPTIPLPEINHHQQKTFTHSIKVKYQYKADLMAMILEPHEINYLTLLTKLTQRTKSDILAIHYQCSSSGTLKELRNQLDLIEAIESSSNSKIFLIVS